MVSGSLTQYLIWNCRTASGLAFVCAWTDGNIVDSWLLHCMALIAVPIDGRSIGTGGFLLGRRHPLLELEGSYSDGSAPLHILYAADLIWFNIVMGSRSNRTLTTFHSACHPSCLLFCFLHNAFAMAVYSSISSNWLQQTPMEVEYILVGHIRYSQELGRHWHHDSLTWINLRPFASTCCVRYAY